MEFSPASTHASASTHLLWSPRNLSFGCQPIFRALASIASVDIGCYSTVDIVGIHHAVGLLVSRPDHQSPCIRRHEDDVPRHRTRTGLVLPTLWPNLQHPYHGV